eukprot:6193784-Prymnesium_polylepis.1
MARLPGSEALLRGLARFDAAERWSVGQAMASDCFEAYRVEAGGEGEGPLEFMHYLHDDE